MKLSKALRLTNPTTIAIVGAGGKTTALFQLALELSPCLLTTTTHIGSWQTTEVDRHILWEEHSPMPDIEGVISTGTLLITGELDNDRYKGLSNEKIILLKQLAGYHDVPLIIEADGARQKALKAPAGHEPSIPPDIEVVIVVAGLSGIGKPLNKEVIHRPEIFAQLSGIKMGENVSSESLVKVLTHPEGGLKNIPDKARKIVFLNQCDTPEIQAQAAVIANQLLTTFDSILITSLKDQTVHAVVEQCAGIILAAGQSSRFGRPKQLLDYKGKPFARAVAEAALSAGLSPIVMVTGAHAEMIESAVKGLGIDLVRNENWLEGQSSSIRAGLASLALESNKIGSAVFLLADLPQVTPTVIRALVEWQAQGLYPIVAPLVDGRRANPVLFDKTTFKDLLALEGDVGGRAIFSNYRVEYMEWLDNKLLLDVDTMEDYNRLLSEE